MLDWLTHNKRVFLDTATSSSCSRIIIGGILFDTGNYGHPAGFYRITAIEAHKSIPDYYHIFGEQIQLDSTNQTYFYAPINEVVGLLELYNLINRDYFMPDAKYRIEWLYTRTNRPFHHEILDFRSTLLAAFEDCINTEYRGK